MAYGIGPIVYRQYLYSINSIVYRDIDITCIRSRVCMCMHMCILYVHTVFMCACTCMYVCVYVRMYLCVFMCMHVCMYVCMCVCICISDTQELEAYKPYCL